MHIVALKSPDSRDQRSVIHPDTVNKILDLKGVTFSFESGIGDGINISDQTFIDLGLNAISRDECLMKGNLIITPTSLTLAESGLVQSGSTVIGMLNPFYSGDELKGLNQSKINAVSMEFIPRITRAQKMDVLSSQANLAGYAAVLEAAQHLSSALPMMMTAAGTLKPAKVFVIGVGVAGLQAIATAKRLGAIVYASDVRKSAAEQIESVGGRFIEVDGMDDFEDEAGYAKPLTPEFIQKVNDTVCGVASDADIIVTTARIFGRPAPITVPSSAVQNFKSGAVVVDMNADVGGNCEDTVAGEVITTDNGVIIVGTSNLPGTIATTASMLYSNNLTTFITSLVDEGEVKISEEDDILVGAPEGSDFYVNGMGGVLICKDGELHPKQTRLGGALE